MKCKVVHVQDGWNMSFTHELRTSPRAEKLKSGECIVAINVAETIARVIDCEGGVHNYYAPEGVKFDVKTLSDMMLRGIGIELEVAPKRKAMVAAPAAKAA